MNGNRRSQCEKVLTHLRAYRSMTAIDAERMHIHRLSGRIYDLRHEGHDIETKMEVKKNEEGATVSFARYVLHE